MKTKLVVIIIGLFFYNNMNSQITNPLFENRNVILELKNIQEAFTTKNKNEISKYFIFPLLKNDFANDYTYLSFQVEIDKNDGAISQEMFDANFEEILRLSNIFKFVTVFKYVNIDVLQYENSVRKTSLSKDNRESNDYSIQIVNKEVHIINSTSRYLHPDKKQELDKGVSGSTFEWIFEYKVSKLILKKVIYSNRI
jgi:hypothetical protein